MEQVAAIQALNPSRTHQRQLRHGCQASAETAQQLPFAWPDNFLYVFKTALGGRMRAATGGGAAGGPSPWGAPPLAALGLARTCRQGAGSKTAELAINDRHPVD